MRINAIDEAKGLYEKFKAGLSSTASRVGSFVKQNPTPLGFVQKKLDINFKDSPYQTLQRKAPQSFPAQYQRGQIVQPIQQGVQQLKQPGALNKLMGAGQIAMGAYGATPMGQVFNVGTGVAAGIGQGIRERKNPLPLIKQATTQPTSFASTGLGVQNPAIALGIDIFTPGGLKKGGKTVQAFAQGPKYKQLEQTARMAAERLRVATAEGLPQKTLGAMQKNLDNMLGELQKMRQTKGAMGIVGKKDPSVSQRVNTNKDVIDAYGKTNSGYNIEGMVKEADKKGYKLWDALIKRVDSQGTPEGRRAGMESILDDLFGKKSPDVTKGRLTYEGKAKENLPYIAGLIDGEGHIRLTPAKNGQGRSYYRPDIIVAQKDRKILDELMSLYGGRIDKQVRPNWDKTGTSEMHYWRLSGRKAVELAKEIEPMLRVKSEQAKRLTALNYDEGGRMIKSTIPDLSVVQPSRLQRAATPPSTGGEPFNYQKVAKSLTKQYGSDIRFSKISDIQPIEDKLSPTILDKYRKQFAEGKSKDWVLKVNEGNNLPFNAVDGNHRLQVLKENGVQYVPVTYDGSSGGARYSSSLSPEEYAVNVLQKQVSSGGDIGVMGGATQARIKASPLAQGDLPSSQRGMKIGEIGGVSKKLGDLDLESQKELSRLAPEEYAAARMKEMSESTSTKQGLPPSEPIAQNKPITSTSQPPSTPPSGSSLPPSIPQGDPVQKIIQALKGAKDVRKQQDILYSQERSKRVARIAGVGERVSGEKGYFGQLGQLKGELPKAEFESIRKQISQPDIDSLFDKVEKTQIFSPFEKVTAKTGLAKLLGGEGGRVPTTGEMKLLGEVFPPEFIQAIGEKRTTLQKLFQLGQEALSIPKSMMATGDLSAAFRQGIALIGRPKQFLPAFRDMFKYAFSDKSYQGLLENIQARPTYKLMRQHKVAITDMGSQLSGREEQFMSTLPEKIPLLGGLVKGSNRAYTGFLTKLRADTFDDILKNAKANGTEWTPKLLDDAAKFVNSATGRGDLGALNKAATILNATLFSPRLIASRVNLLNPVYYAKLDPFVRKEALKSILTSAGIITGIATMAKLGGMDVGTDPRSADFLKVKSGNTRWDIGGGFAQYIRLVAQLSTGEIISSTTGRKMTVGEGYKPITRLDIIQRFLENKESPVASFITQSLKGQTNIGEDFNTKEEIVKRFIPLVAQDMAALQKEYGVKGLAMGIPGIFGIGSQTYGPVSNVGSEPTINELTKVKNTAVDYYARGNKEEALKLKSKYKFQVTQKDIDKQVEKNKRLAAEAYVTGDKKEAMAIKKDYGFTVTQEDMKIAAKKVAVRLYKEGKIEEAKELKTKYGFTISQKDLE